MYRSTREHANVDGLSRFPLHVVPAECNNIIDVIHDSQFDSAPMTSAQIEHETETDRVLYAVYQYTREFGQMRRLTRNSNNSSGGEMKCHYTLAAWCGLRVVVPLKLQARVLREVHAGHVGVVKMKAQARNYIVLPGLDIQNEQTAKECSSYQSVQNNPEHALLHTWPWEKSHVVGDN